MPATTTLGKRKSRTGAEKPRPSKRPQSGDDEDNETSAQDAQAIFAKFFEAQFEPLPEANSAKKTKTTSTKVVEDMDTDDDDEDDDDEDEDEEDSDNDQDEDDEAWSGVSESEDDSPTTHEIEVISHIDPTSSSTLADKKARKALLSSKVPSASLDDSTSTSSLSSKSKAAKSTPTEEDAPTLLANDLELQRLLNESHLFNPSKVGSLSNHVTHHHSSAVDSTSHHGRNRLLANDLRMAALGSKTSIYAQQKMPMSHRKGMNAAAVNRESKRRREARENGIILERPSSGMDAVKKYTRAAGAVRSKDSRSMGDRKKSRAGEIDAPAVGRMSGGMLKLSKKDIRDIESSGPRRRDGGKGKKKRR